MIFQIFLHIKNCPQSLLKEVPGLDISKIIFWLIYYFDSTMPECYFHMIWFLHTKSFPLVLFMSSFNPVHKINRFMPFTLDWSHLCNVIESIEFKSVTPTIGLRISDKNYEA